MSHQGVQGAKCLFNRGDGIVAVDLIKVDVVHLQALQAGVYGVHDVSARGADIVAALADAAIDFRGDDQVFAGDVEILKGLAEDSFALAAGVDVGGVEEIDAGVDGGFYERVGLGLIGGADHFPDAGVGHGGILVAAEGHGAKAESGNEKSSVT